ncbi:41499_t:CDS:2, partial [Gigaspora margarita]
MLEANNAILADCFVYLIKLAVSITNLPKANTFKISAIYIFNQCYDEFLHPLYILAYYIHPQYRAALTSIELWQNLGHTKSESDELVTQMFHFEANLPLFDLSYVPNIDTPKIWWGSFKNQSQHLAELALRIFSINPMQANCERNFSALKWILGERQTHLDLNRLEGIAKIRSYHITNIRCEISCLDKELTETDFQDACNLSSVSSIMSYEDNQLEVKSSSIETAQAISSNLDYNPLDVLNSFLECEKQDNS